MLLLAACDTGFEDPALVKDLRVLAIKTAPPEVLYPAVAPWAVPADVPRAFDLTVLIADPGHAGRPLTCSFATCVPDRNRRCEDPAATTRLGEGPCTDGETTFRVEIPAEAIAAAQGQDPFWLACVQAAAADPAANCYSGLAVWIEVRVSGGGRDLYALKSVVFSPELPAGRQPNANPVITGIQLDEGAVVPPGADGVVPIAYTPGATVRMDLTRDAASKEDYALPTFEGGVRDLVEYLSIQFLSDAGSFSQFSRTDRPSNPFAADPDSEEPAEMWSKWTAPAAGETGADRPVRFWLVMSDGRGGVSWIRAIGTPAP